MKLKPAFLVVLLSTLAFFLLTPVLASDNSRSLQLPRKPQRNEKPSRMHQNFSKIAKSIRVIAIAPTQVKAVHYVNDIPEQRSDWTETGMRGASKALKSRFEHNARVVFLDRNTSASAECEDIYPLYDAIRSSIVKHASKGRDVFYEKFRDFDYSVGSIETILDKVHADALLVTTVYTVIYSKSLQASQQGGYATSALIDRSGDLLWFSESGTAIGYDIRTEWGVQGILRQALTGFPL